MTLKEILHGTGPYQEMVQLRLAVLRKPLGLDFTIEALNKEKNDTFLAAFHLEKIIACCILSNPEGDTIHLRQMAVDNQHQKQGIGSFILGYAEKKAMHKGYHYIRLHARLSARSFYERHGYHCLGDIFEEVTIPHILMQKKLT
jgi:predicted GNAT family N-acyltransferase